MDNILVRINTNTYDVKFDITDAIAFFIIVIGFGIYFFLKKRKVFIEEKKNIEEVKYKSFRPYYNNSYNEYNICYLKRI